VFEAGMAHFHAGAGIVADSVPEREWEETWHKAAALLPDALGSAEKSPDIIRQRCFPGKRRVAPHER
jgi:anthranilate/para-aminobenzoate synthase component I